MKLLIYRTYMGIEGDQESRAEKGTVVGSREGFLEEAESESLEE